MARSDVKIYEYVDSLSPEAREGVLMLVKLMLEGGCRVTSGVVKTANALTASLPTHRAKQKKPCA